MGTAGHAKAAKAPNRGAKGVASLLTAADAELVQLARAARGHAYSPYSKIRVGAALRATDGRVFTGCNVENASFGLTICAERSAVVKAASEGGLRFDAIAIATSLARVMMPCGACRQVLAEFAPNLRVLVVGNTGGPLVTSLGHLLPDAFGPDAFQG